eukprot:2571519-Rhodomonas_salina.1
MRLRADWRPGRVLCRLPAGRLVGRREAARQIHDGLQPEAVIPGHGGHTVSAGPAPRGHVCLAVM